MHDYYFLVGFLIRQAFFVDALQKTLVELKVSKDDRTGIYPSILDAHIFHPDENGETPFDYFLKHATLTRSQKNIYKLWQENSFFSFFEVVDIKKPQIVDISSDKNYLVDSFLTKEKLSTGDLITARIAPTDESKKVWIMLAGNTTSYPREAIEILKSELKKSSYEMNELEVVKYAITQKA